MTRQDLLPSVATPLERALSLALDREDVLAGAIDVVRGVKLQPVRRADFAPWIVQELGLGGLSSYFADPDMMIEAGVAWQRVRGTPLALAMALAWLGYADLVLEDAKTGRRKWHRYQLGMGASPSEEMPLLRDAEQLAALSSPVRSVFFRGWHAYDVRSLAWSETGWSGTIWGDDSGARLSGGSAKWSHGEDVSGSVVAGPAQRAALGVDWHRGDDPGWIDVPWDAPGLSWEGIVDLAAFKSFMIRRLEAHVGFVDDQGALIGLRRPVTCRDGSEPDSPEAVRVRFECRTGFGDGAGAHVGGLVLVFKAAHRDKPGALWIAPDDIAFPAGALPQDMILGEAPADFTLRQTVRLHATLTLDI